jgi:hypothetical protein
MKKTIIIVLSGFLIACTPQAASSELTLSSEDDSYKYYQGDVVLSGTFETKGSFGGDLDCLILDEASKQIVPPLLTELLREPYVCFSEDSVEVQAADGDQLELRIDSLDLMYRETAGNSWINVVEAL